MGTSCRIAAWLHVKMATSDTESELTGQGAVQRSAPSRSHRERESSAAEDGPQRNVGSRSVQKSETLERKTRTRRAPSKKIHQTTSPASTQAVSSPVSLAALPSRRPN